MIKGTAVDREDPRAKKVKGRVKGTLIVRTDNQDMPVFKAEVRYLIRL